MAEWGLRFPLLSPADPLQEQLLQLQQGVSIYDSCPLQRCRPSVLLPVSHNGSSTDCVVGFHASGAAAFSEEERQPLKRWLS